MDYKIISRNNVTMVVHNDEAVTPPSVTDCVRTALTVCGYKPWQCFCVECFPGQTESLLVAHPETGIFQVQMQEEQDCSRKCRRRRD